MNRTDEPSTLGETRAPRVLLALLCGGLLSFSITSGCDDDDDAGGSGGSGSTTTTSTGTGDACSEPNDCPDPGNECVVRLCLDHKCGALNAAHGTPLLDQVDGDCKVAVCDGNGGTTTIDDNADIDNDGLECTKDACDSGSPTHDPAAVGTLCVEGGGRRCDGHGACVDCVSDVDCAVGACSAGSCVPQTCTDTVKNGGETDVDCGGPDCAACGVGLTCSVGADCASNLCVNSACATTQPIITPISSTGHDRFFNLTFDPQGNILAVGVVAPGTDTSTDYATVIAKFSPAGVLDTTFGTNGFAIENLATGTNGELARAIGLQSTGKIIVAATVEHVGASDPRDRDVAVMRRNPNGTLDASFGMNGIAILNLSEGVLVGNSFLADSVWHLVVQPDDKIVLSGSQVRPGGNDTDFAMIRLLPNGAMDTSFGNGGKVLVDIDNANASARSLTLLPDGSLMGAGYMDVDGVGTPVVYKVNSHGVLDPTFGTGGVFNAVVLAAQTEAYAIVPQGTKFVTTGYGRSNASTESLDWLSLRLLPNGTLDPTYGADSVARIDIAGFNDNSRYLLVLPDNRVVLAGGGRPTANNVDGAIGVLTPNGQPDVTFSPTGVKLYDLGGGNDFLWSISLSPSQEYVALAGIRGIATGSPGNDDAALLLVPIN